MSSYLNDENDESYGDYLEPFVSSHSQIDSGYLTLNSPCRLSPSHVLYNQFESPLSDVDFQSPRNRLIEKFVSTIDYENYVSTRKYFDILTQLNCRNAQHLIEKVFSYLTTKDLECCSYVCRKWQLICQDYTRRQQTKTVKRNLFDGNDETHANHSIQHLTKKLTSTPMQMITNKSFDKSMLPIPIESEENHSQDTNVHLTASTMTFRYGYLKYLHGPTITKRCPICSFVSIVDVNDQHG